MRGALTLHDPAAENKGIIPAYAGSTFYNGSARSSYRDHPRVCGEHDGIYGPNTKRAGSSPRMRGAPDFVIVKATQGGIIPAYAGSTPMVVIIIEVKRDHPRVCGEHVMIQGVFCAPTGSSPRMRGAPNHRGFTSPWVGIIPAYAGSTRW